MAERITVREPMGGDSNFGAIRAVYSIKDALCYVNGGQGCAFYSRIMFGWHEQGVVRALSSALEHEQVIFGGEEAVREGLEQAVEVFHPKLIVIQNTCIPNLIGDDVEGIARMVSRRSGVKILSVNNPNYKGNMLDGYKNVVASYITNLMDKPEAIRKRSINLLGIMPGEYNWINDLRELIRMVTAIGLSVNCVLVGENTKVDDIIHAPRAEANVLVHPEVGISHAKLMEERFGTPFIDVDFPPYGMDSNQRWLMSIAEFFDLKKEAEVFIDQEMKRIGEAFIRLNAIQVSPIQMLSGKKYALEAPPYIIPAMVKFLYEDLSMVPHVVAFQELDKLSLEKLEKIAKENNFVTEIQTYGDHREFKEAIKRDYVYPWGDPFVAFGSSLLAFHFVLNGVFVPVIRFTYPVYDEAIITDRPFVGFRGVLTIAEMLHNIHSSLSLNSRYVCGYVPNPFDMAAKYISTFTE